MHDHHNNAFWGSWVVLAMACLLPSFAKGGDCTKLVCPNGKVCSYGSEQPFCYCPGLLPLTAAASTLECIPDDRLESFKAELNALEVALERDDLEASFFAYKARYPDKPFSAQFAHKGKRLRKMGEVFIGVGVTMAVLGGLGTALLYASVDDLKESMMSLGILTLVVFIIPPLISAAGVGIASAGIASLSRGRKLLKKMSPLLIDEGSPTGARAVDRRVGINILLDRPKVPAGLGISWRL